MPTYRVSIQISRSSFPNLKTPKRRGFLSHDALRGSYCDGVGSLLVIGIGFWVEGWLRKNYPYLVSLGLGPHQI